MDEDIDIEEHDVLDNPKIRDIFPDLSLVKIEPPDVNEQDFRHDVPVESESQDDEMMPIIKREVLSDDENYTSAYHHNEFDHNYVRAANMSCDIDQNEQTATYEDEQRGMLYENEQRAIYENEQRAILYENGQRATSENEQRAILYENGQSVTYEHEQSEETICDYDQTAVENRPNKIILGTKPVLDYDKLYEEAKNSKAIVYLEDWDYRLKTSPCYCHSCEILYPTVNCLDFHRSISHSLLVALDTSRKTNTPTRNTARKSTVKSTYCNHCDKTFPSDTELIKHLYKLLPVGNYEIPTPTPVKIEVNAIQYKCIKCKLYFVSVEDGEKHRITCHQDCLSDKIIFKVQKAPKSNIQDEVQDNNRTSYKIGEWQPDFSLLPKGVLFQCNTCLICFVSYYSALQHSRNCTKKGFFQKCSLCKRKIRSNHFKAHKMQHMYNDKFKIYNLNMNLGDKIIVKCPSCGVCFDEKGFWSHRSVCNGKKVNFSHCDVCSIDIKESRYANHKLCHNVKKYTKKDFIIIEFHKPSTQSQKSLQNTLYFCDMCGSYKTLRSFKGHTKGACHNLGIKFCDICGLGFGRVHYRIHRMTHDNFKLNSISDFEILSLHSGKKIEPPMPQFHRCDSCNIHFLVKYDVLNHTCDNEKFMTCKICNEKFNLKAFVPHSKFHDFIGHNFKDDMPELLKMYNSINNMWDIVYVCLNCSIITMTYDSAVEHSQSHICGEKKTSYKTCEICNFNIVENDYMIHVNLHENNAALNRQQFRILKFNYKDMYKKKWMNIFMPLPIKDKHQILAKSIYRCTRRFKLNCEIYYRTDDTKFYCKKCKTSVSIEDMKRHYFDGKCKFVSKYVCKICKMDFKTLRECVTHENEHENLKKIYKVYSFNDKNDKEINKKLLNFDCNKNNKIKIAPRVVAPKGAVKKFARKPQIKMAAAKNKMAGDKNKMAASKNKLNLYKCRKCETCVCFQKSVRKHRCNTIKKGICHLCNNAFFPRNLARHIEMHEYYGNKTSVTYFNPVVRSGININTPTQKAIIYKCDCGLHFTSKQSIENHLSVCSDDFNVSKEICSKCHRLFPTDVLVTHLCKHHSKPVTFHVIEIPRKGNFKCGFCNVIYLNMVDFDNHIFQCPLKSGKICSECLLAYDSTSFAGHTCNANESMFVVKKSVSASIVFKCNQCNLHYFNLKSLKYHFDQEHNCQRKIVACDICNLRFTERGFNKHILMHESGKRQYIIKIVDGTENSHIIKGDNNKKDNRTTIITNSDDNHTNNETESVSKANNKVKKVVKELPTVAEEEEIDIKTTISTGVLYRCNACDLCYHFKKTWNYHIEMKHINKRPVVKCEVCGLQFTTNSLINHAPIHETSDEYVIQVHEMDEGKITEIKGKNVQVVTKEQDLKRHAELPVSPLRIKTRKSNNTNVFIPDDSHEASPSKMDIESVSKIDDEDKTTRDLINESNAYDLDNVTDPLVDFSELNVPDDIDNSVSDETNNENKLNTSDVLLSHKMKTLLHNYLENYNNVLYECAHCRVCFLTQMACVSHFKRADHKKDCKFVNCDECGLAFTMSTLVRHKYIHHDIMKLTSESLYVLPVPEEYNTNKKITDLLHNNIAKDKNSQEQEEEQEDKTNEENMDIEESTENNLTETGNTHDDIPDANTDEVNMDVDDNVVKDTEIHIYQEPNWNTQNDVTEASNAENIIVDNTEEVNMDTDENVQKECKIHYYKCAECNVCFIKEDLCRTHCVSHKKFDPRMYIECKMCSFQFPLNSLMEHVTLHHDNEFCLEDLAVTEYTPSIDGHLKIETYRGIDKVQSRLVSTTTDLSTEVKTIKPVTVENNN